MDNKLLSELIKEKSLLFNIQVACQDLLDEDERYAADEIVSLADEVLKTLAAFCFQVYMFQPKQNTSYNNFLMNIITQSEGKGGLSINAGVLFSWGADMIKLLDDEVSKIANNIFWPKGVLNIDLLHFMDFRNQVMHGFFVLPPERNIKETKRLIELIEQLFDCGLLNSQFLQMNLTSRFPCFTKNDEKLILKDSFALEDNELNELLNILDNNLAIRENINQVKKERSGFYFKENKIEFNSSQGNNKDKDYAKNFVLNSKKGVLLISYPWDKVNESKLSGIYQELNKNDKYFPIPFIFSKSGLNFTWQYVKQTVLNEIINNFEIGKQTDLLKACNKIPKEVIIIVEDIHINMFHPDHFLKSVNFLYENNIKVICSGLNYSFVRKFANKFILNDSFTIPNNASKYRGTKRKRLQLTIPKRITRKILQNKGT